MDTPLLYLEPAGSLFHPPKRHLHILKVHGLAEGEPDLASAVARYDAVGARPPRFCVVADAVVSQRGQTAESAASREAAVLARENIVGGGRYIHGGLGPDLNVLAASLGTSLCTLRQQHQ